MAFNPKETVMLYWSMVFLVIALVAGAMGFFGTAAVAQQIAWALFVVFLALFVISLIAGNVRRPVA